MKEEKIRCIENGRVYHFLSEENYNKIFKNKAIFFSKITKYKSDQDEFESSKKFLEKIVLDFTTEQKMWYEEVKNLLLPENFYIFCTSTSWEDFMKWREKQTKKRHTHYIEIVVDDLLENQKKVNNIKCHKSLKLSLQNLKNEKNNFYFSMFFPFYVPGKNCKSCTKLNWIEQKDEWKKGLLSKKNKNDFLLHLFHFFCCDVYERYREQFEFRFLIFLTENNLDNVKVKIDIEIIKNHGPIKF